MGKRIKRIEGQNVIRAELAYRSLLLLASVIVVGALAAYHFTPATDSDMVEGVIWADTTLRSGRLLNPDYAYPYAIPFGSNLFMLPFVAIFGVGMLSNSLGMLFFFSVVVMAAVLFMRTFTRYWVYTAAGTAVILLAFRSRLGENLLHHVLYYQLGFVCFLGVCAMALRFLKGQEGWKVYAPLFFFALWSGANGAVTVSLSSFPVLAALLALVLFNPERIENKRVWKCIRMIAGSTACGLGVYALAMRGVEELDYVGNAGSFTFLGAEAWAENLRALPLEWLKLFLMSNPEGVSIATREGLGLLASLPISLAVGLAPVAYLLRYKSLNTAELLVFYASVAVWAACLMQYIFLRGALDRLLYNGLYADFILLGVAFALYAPVRWKPRIITVIVAVGIAAFALAFVHDARWTVDTELTDYLESRGLKYGYASFWNANYNTVLSNNRVRIRDVTLNNGFVTPEYWQSEKAWYESKQEGQFFLLLTEQEMQEIIDGPNHALLESAAETVNIAGFQVLVYADEQWDSILHHRNLTYRFHDAIWSNGCDTVEDVRYIHDGGESYGPYMPLEQGGCMVVITGEALENSRIEVYSAREGIYLQPNYHVLTNTEIVFDVRTDRDLSGLEVCVSNPADDEYTADVILTSMTLDAS